MLDRALRAESGISSIPVLSMSRYRFEDGERVSIGSVVPSEYWVDEKMYVEVFTDKVVYGKKASIVCAITDKEIEMLKPGVIMRMDGEDIYLISDETFTRCGVEYVRLYQPGARFIGG